MTHATSPADLADMDVLRHKSGLEFMRALASGDLPGAPIAAGMEIDLDEVDDGRIAFTGTPRFAHMNPMGGIHGGWYATILDSAMACAVMTRVPCGSTYTTLEFKVNITRALPADTKVRCVGLVAHAGRSTAVATGEIRGAADDRLYATGTTTCLIMALPPA
ncbi:PaaI family thioesterase [Maribius pontilimi]|uniref:PaaI family thioesterase n=1 Tax=Palleronia pontilimi TaxID=1964209 RepID=A0A934M8U6_9RHOB|nr:PaaI family thioesterase [Palleronia pontilimi]MBJ3761807.1 PaaI family thioesterase [Palleronia pontilimi]